MTIGMLRNSTKKFLLFAYLVLNNCFSPPQIISQEYNPFIQAIVDELEYDSMYSKLEAFENLGVKQVGSSALNQTGQWIIQQHQQFGYTDIELDVFYTGGNQVYNIIVTKTGTLFPDRYLIVDGHYDTYNGPGVNDNGSGTAIVLEVARLLAGIETSYSIRFIHFTAEEIGLVGSNHYVQNVVLPQDMDIRLVFNIDEVGGVAGEVNNTITCERDQWPPISNNEASAAFTDTLANLTQLYSNLLTEISYAYGSDYIPFMNNGYVVTGFYEENESPYPHTINDSLSKLDPVYVYEVAKAALAATLYFSGAYDTGTGIHGLDSAGHRIRVGPNPFHEFFEITYPSEQPRILQLYDVMGNLLWQEQPDQGFSDRIIPPARPGMYLLKITSPSGELLLTAKLIKK